MTGDGVGSTAAATSGAPAVAPRPLRREHVLREAVRFIDTYGRERLTMRRLGAELGVEAMALYRYVPGREQLLDGVVEYVMDELYDSTMLGQRAETWQLYLEEQAHGVRQMAIRHPRIFPLVATRPPAAPWLRPPLRSLRWVEGFLEALAFYGFSAQGSVVVYRSFATFLLGHLLLEAATHGGDLLAEEEEMAGAAPAPPTDLSEYPRLLALSSELSQDGYGVEFEDALEELLDRIAIFRS